MDRNGTGPEGLGSWGKGPVRHAIRTKLYGNIVIEKQTDHYLTFTAGGKEREFALPGCITNGFLIPEDPEIMERCKKEAEMLEKLKQLNSEQRLTNIEFRKY